MIKLIKKISRETLSITGRKKKPVIVSLLPGDEISFRVKGAKTEQTVYLGQCFVLAQILSLERLHREKVAEYEQKKKAGYKRLKRPKKPNLPFNKMYFEAINK